MFTWKYLRTPDIEPGLAEPSLKASNQQSRRFRRFGSSLSLI
jgi:hypothetical protein